MPWISGSAAVDLAVLYLPGLAALAASFLLPSGAPAVLTYAFIVALVLDGGHVYTTALRVFREDTDRLYAGLLYVGLAVVVFVWLRLGLAHLFSLIIYVTVFHHVRQFYGLFRLYDGGRTPAAGAEIFLFYGLQAVPFLGMHFRPVSFQISYTNRELFFHPEPRLLAACQAVWAVMALCWLALEARRWRAGTTHLGRTLSFAFPAVLQGLCFFLGASMVQVILPLYVSHGVAYLYMVGLSLERVAPRVSGAWKIGAIVVGANLAGALFDHLLTDHAVQNEYMTKPLPTWALVASAVVLAPGLWHYILDASLWKRDHPSFAPLWAPKKTG